MIIAAYSLRPGDLIYFIVRMSEKDTKYITQRGTKMVSLEYAVKM